ncbi:hypothetical protein BGW36DRAFT_368201 [Talaromyces proteolyticus]|uniref:Uncharacterized protein n=1 Tax=Talaromyces proteolyticus TaxID=1131652 RepID=A0AAD4Q6M8_9EURO|nr:uncharacterized protein BGW36DRAFT_368201 [Talaromyces proteolyticus]KAH8705808.1 hypothetical protein BGW36DRAFT_368201 [Talaromyces proteolyticus]
MGTKKHESAFRKREAGQCLERPSRGPFIIATGHDNIKPDARSRKFIRHHVMRGKNQKRVASQDYQLGSWINREHEVPMSQLVATIKGASEGRVPNPIKLQISGLSCIYIGFSANDMGPCTLQLLYEFINAVNKAMYPGECCVDIHKAGQCWFESLSYDPAYAQAVLYTAQAYFDFVKSRVLGPKAIRHINATMHLLQQSLAEPNEATSDSTIFTIMALAMVSDVLGDLETAKKHLLGLYQVISTRGGIETLSQNRSLQVKCCRLDLLISLKIDSRPLFYAGDNISWSTYLIATQKIYPTTTPVNMMCEIPDFRLANVWLDLREFIIAINLAHQTHRTISAELFQETLISVQYRLQHLSYNNCDPHEILRLSMLAISNTIFLKADGDTIHYQSSAEKLRVALQFRNPKEDRKGLELNLWLIFVNSIYILDLKGDACLLMRDMRTISRELRLSTWEAIRTVLKSFLWVDVMYDKHGKKFFNEGKALESG